MKTLNSWLISSVEMLLAASFGSAVDLRYELEAI